VTTTPVLKLDKTSVVLLLILGTQERGGFLSSSACRAHNFCWHFKKVEERKRGKPPSSSVLAASSKNCE